MTNPKLTEQIENNFSYHTADAEKTLKMSALREEFKALAHRINELCPDSREKSLALTQLEIAQLEANESIVRY